MKNNPAFWKTTNVYSLGHYSQIWNGDFYLFASEIMKKEKCKMRKVPKKRPILFQIFSFSLCLCRPTSFFLNDVSLTRWQLTLSGLLNFIDGLWSCCGDERIIVFTTNHKDRLDPALLRPGRMDMHIHMSYCTPCGFKILASNYLGLTNHSLFTEIEKLITEVEVTPAEIAEELMKSDEADVALKGLVKYLGHWHHKPDQIFKGDEPGPTKHWRNQTTHWSDS